MSTRFYIWENTKEDKPRSRFYSSASTSYVRGFIVGFNMCDRKLFLEKANAPLRLTKKRIFTDDERLFKMLVVYNDSIQNVKKSLHTVLGNDVYPLTSLLHILGMMNSLPVIRKGITWVTLIR